MTTPRYFSCALNVSGRDCLVIGGDREAYEKALRLARAGGRVTLKGPLLPGEWAHALEQAGVAVRQAEPGMVDPGAPFLVVLTEKTDRLLTERIARLCRERHVLLCAIDQPEFCDLVNVAAAERGLLSVAVSTSGAAPVLGRQIRAAFEKLLDMVPVERFLDAMAKKRRAMEAAGVPAAERRERMLQATRDIDVRVELKLPPEPWENL